MMRSAVARWCLVATLALPGLVEAQTPAAPAPPAAPPATAPVPPPATGQERTAGLQAPPGQPTQCGLPVPLPAKLPPAGSGPVVYTLAPCFERQGGASVIEPQTYLYYIKLRPSRPSADVWVPYTEETERTIVDDFRTLWNTNFLDDLSVEVTDYVFENGVVGKMVTYHIEERQRVKIVEYVGSEKLEQSKIEEKLRELGITVRLDSFIDPGVVRRVEGVLREMLSEKGFLGANVSHVITPVAGGPKLVNLSFRIEEGPQYKIRDIEFIGNEAISDGSLGRRMKENKEQWFLSFITGRGTYQETKFEEDADRIVEYYRDRGYIAARVGSPEVKVLEDSADKSKRFIQLRVPVEEGRRYRVGTFDFAGNNVVKSEGLRQLFNKIKEGNYYSEKQIRKGLEKAREVYGQIGYFEFTGYPDLQPRDMPKPPADGSAPTPEEVEAAKQAPPVVDVTMRMQEGKQYFVNRVTFVGNTTTRDNVIRREIRLLENGVFNTEALKYSVKRLNQLGYFKNLEGDAIKVEKAPGFDNRVDVTLKFEEQNRNQLTFGAGVSQFEGFFGQLAFQTSNFMGRGETLSLGLQAGERSQNYQLAFTEPFLFDRPITGGFDIYKREVRYISQFTQGSTGGNLVFGFPVADFTRAYMGYSFERVTVKDINELYLDEDVIKSNPFLADALLIGAGGARTISKIQPSIRYDTIDNPIFPTQGKRFSAGVELAGLGGDTRFYKPRLESIVMFKQTNRTSLAVRGLVEFVGTYGSSKVLPIFERLYLGGEYSVRGYDLRTIGPREPISNLVIGGTKSLLFNTEYLISIAGPVRLVLFYDAGQVRDDGQRFTLNEFKTSTGAEVRFFMPVLNVPFRLIFAYNPQRDGVLDNSYRPQKAFTFRFAVGSTF
ncbi:MAG: BamA/TamA family outer membrane protein [Vicinamibacteraceae bacterium]|nr:BamA/TamA family outer membrane protein [Vicinamibacteraceae bacterium]